MYTVWSKALAGSVNLPGFDLALTSIMGIAAIAIGLLGLLSVLLVIIRRRHQTDSRPQARPDATIPPESRAIPAAAGDATHEPVRALESAREIVVGVPTAPLRDRSEWRVSTASQSRPILAPAGDLADADTGPLSAIAVAPREPGGTLSGAVTNASPPRPLEDHQQDSPDSRATPAMLRRPEDDYQRGIELLSTSAGVEQPLRDALTCFRRAQEVWTRELASERWAIVQNEIGRVYQELPGGDRATNLRTAIMHYQTALEVFDPVRHAMNWAWTQSALGAIYQALPSGSPIANARAAVAYHQRALDVFTRENAPLAWAWNQNNLGAALETMRGGEQGERVAHLRAAADCYEAALQVYTAQEYHAYHDVVARNLARVQNELKILE